ncbi:TlpA family protein disulfide reductase [Alkaliflexus imshenetskii]|uniref:TlpA family protein disulfide reductase n=1 Tax=Alkaliflexus imshenetskii TaxID=286730 RepID=UPI0004786E10|nr:TlpA disulfide reductase family protein [Alkaliflexus imshenetskii]
MKNVITTTIKITAGIFAILIPFYLVIHILDNLVFIQDYPSLKWVQLLIIASGFYISGIINSKTPLQWIPLLYISLLVCVPMRSIYFPFFIFVILFATIGLFITRKEFEKKYRLLSFCVLIALFGYFLLSQPLIIRKTKEISYHNDELQNAIVLWDFTKGKSDMLPKHTFKDVNNNDFQLQSLKGKTVYVTFWATWCKPCIKEKPALEKLKNDFKDSANIVFVDIALDGEKQWRNYLEKNNPTGIQLLSKNEAKTRALFEFAGIPYAIIIYPDGRYSKGTDIRISMAYNLLSENGLLSDSGKSIDNENHSIFLFAKITDNTSKDFMIVIPDTTDYYKYQNGNEAIKLLSLLDAFYSEMVESGIKIPRYVYFGIENTIQRNDSTINVGYFKTSDVELKSLK